MKILNEDSDSNEHNNYFLEIDGDLSDINVVYDNHSTNSKIICIRYRNYSKQCNTDNFYMGKIKKISKREREKSCKIVKIKAKNIINKMPGQTFASNINIFLKLIDMNVINERVNCTYKCKE